MAFTAVSACVHCEPEPRDTSAKALIATLRKRLSLTSNPLPPYACDVQVRRRSWQLRKQLSQA